MNRIHTLTNCSGIYYRLQILSGHAVHFCSAYLSVAAMFIVKQMNMKATAKKKMIMKKIETGQVSALHTLDVASKLLESEGLAIHEQL